MRARQKRITPWKNIYYFVISHNSIGSRLSLNINMKDSKIVTSEICSVFSKNYTFSTTGIAKYNNFKFMLNNLYGLVIELFDLLFKVYHILISKIKFGKNVALLKLFPSTFNILINSRLVLMRSKFSDFLIMQ